MTVNFFASSTVLAPGYTAQRGQQSSKTGYTPDWTCRYFYQTTLLPI